MNQSITLNADFKDGTPVAVVSPTTANDRLDPAAIKKVHEMWRQVVAKRRLNGQTTKTIAPPNWWFNADTDELAAVMEWLDSPAIHPSASVGERTNFLTATKRHVRQVFKGFA